MIPHTSFCPSMMEQKKVLHVEKENHVSSLKRKEAGTTNFHSLSGPHSLRLDALVRRQKGLPTGVLKNPPGFYPSGRCATSPFVHQRFKSFQFSTPRSALQLEVLHGRDRHLCVRDTENA